MLTSGGLTGGLSSTIAGGKFIDGFRQGLITSGLNHVAHMFVVSGQSSIRTNEEEEASNKAEILDPNASQTGGAKAARILSSIISYDPSKSFVGKVLQIFGHFTWELPQQFLGILTGEFTNLIGGIESVYKYSNGAIVLNNRWMGAGAGLTMGNIITIGSGSKSDVLSHEFGHYIQSRRFGPLWTPVFGIPSIVRAGLWSTGIVGGTYDSFYTEKNATKLGGLFSGF